MQETAYLAQLQRRGHSRRGEHDCVVLAVFSTCVYTSGFESRQRLLRKRRAKPFFVEQGSLRRHNLRLGARRKKFPKQLSSRLSPQRLDRLQKALITDPLDPSLVLVKKDIPENHVRKTAARKFTQKALECLFVAFPRASAVHQRQI